MQEVIATIKLAPGVVGLFDPATRIHLMISNPTAQVYAGQNTQNLIRWVRQKKAFLVSGSLTPETKPEQPVKAAAPEKAVVPEKPVKEEPVEKPEEKTKEELAPAFTAEEEISEPVAAEQTDILSEEAPADEAPTEAQAEEAPAEEPVKPRTQSRSKSSRKK